MQAVVDYFGPTDLSAFGKDDSAQRSMLGPFIGAKFADNPEAHEKASPIKYVTKDAPPFLIFHGTEGLDRPDRTVAAAGGEAEGRRGAVKLVEVPDEGHGWGGQANGRHDGSDAAIPDREVEEMTATMLPLAERSNRPFAGFRQQQPARSTGSFVIFVALRRGRPRLSRRRPRGRRPCSIRLVTAAGSSPASASP